MALLPFGGNKIALKSRASIVIPTTTNPLTTGLRPRKPIQTLWNQPRLPDQPPSLFGTALIKTFNCPRSEVYLCVFPPPRKGQNRTQSGIIGHFPFSPVWSFLGSSWDNPQQIIQFVAWIRGR
jgi:hypothetical protein